MSSAETAFGSPYPQRIGEEIVDFPRLLMEDYGSIESTIRTQRREVHKALLEDSKVTGVDRFVAMREVEILDIQPEDVNRYLLTYAGAKRALEISLKRAGKTPDEMKSIISTLDHMTATRLARILIGFIIPSRADAESGEDQPNPKSPAA